MAIKDTSIYKMLLRARRLSEQDAWMKTFDTATKQQIVDWIQKDQITNKGVDKFGKTIGYYSYATELITKGRKQQGDHYTLFNEGYFYRSMYVVVFKDEIAIDANSPSFTEMQKQDWYKDAILGLTDENFQKLKEIVKNSAIDYERKVLGIG